MDFTKAEGGNGIFIRVYDRAFQVIYEIDDIISIVIDREFYYGGSFEAFINYDRSLMEILNKDCYLFMDNRPDRVFVIEDMIISDHHGPVKIKGPSLLGCLSRRIVIPPVGENYLRYHHIPAEDIMIGYVLSQGGIFTADERRKIPGLTAVNSSHRGRVMSYRATFCDNLLDVLSDIGIYASLGHRLVVDISHKSFLYEVVSGRDLSPRDPAHPPVIFSSAFDNIVQGEYEEKLSLYKNAVYGVAGDIEMDDFRVYLARDVQLMGLDLKEEYYFVSAEDYDDLVFETARKMFSLCGSRQTISAEITDTEGFRYEQDWDLGDIVTVEHTSAGKRMAEQITSIREVYEYNGSHLELCFGLMGPDFKQRIVDIEKRVKMIK